MAANLVYEQDEEAHIMQDFVSIWGVGANLAQQWIEKGYKNVDDVLQGEDVASLSAQVKLGLRHRDDLAQRIPRKV